MAASSTINASDEDSHESSSDGDRDDAEGLERLPRTKWLLFVNPSVYSVHVRFNMTGDFVQYKNLSATPNAVVCENQSRCSFPETGRSTFVIVRGDIACSKDDQEDNMHNEDEVHVAINLNFPHRVEHTLVYVLVGVAVFTIAVHVFVLIRRKRKPVRRYKWHRRPKISKAD